MQELLQNNHIQVKIAIMKFKISDSNLIDLLGGTNQVSRMVGTSPAAVAQWKNNGIPAGQLVVLGARLEKVSAGLVTRQDLFPTTWHLIWPELLPKPNLCL